MQAEEYFNSLVGDFPEGAPGKMFGALCMKLPNGKAAAMFWKNFLVVKLPEKEREGALKLKGAQLFDPMDGRPMKEWVQVPFDHKSKWKELMASSVKFTKSIPSKVVKPTKSKTKASVNSKTTAKSKEKSTAKTSIKSKAATKKKSGAK